MRLVYLAVGVLLLLTSSYLDNTRGPLLPVLSSLFELSYTQKGFFLVLGNIASVLGTFLLIPLSQRFSERSISSAVFLIIISVVVGSWAVHALPALWVFSIGVGTMVSVAGATANLCIIKGADDANRTRAMALLHLAYGMGSLLSPMIVALLMLRGVPWQTVPNVVLLTCTIGLLILWKGFSGKGHVDPIVLPQKSALSGQQIFVVVTFCTYVAGEVLLSMWMTSYLVSLGNTLTQSSAWLTGFFTFMALSRGACFIRMSPRTEKRILVSCLLVSAAFFTLGYRGWTPGFALAGVLGPFFPVFMARASRDYPEQSRTLTLWILTMMQLTLAMFHFLVGSLADRFGIQTMYLLPPTLLVLSAGMTVKCLRSAER